MSFTTMQEMINTVEFKNLNSGSKTVDSFLDNCKNYLNSVDISEEIKEKISEEIISEEEIFILRSREKYLKRIRM